ncbi:unnamed protein product, partial [Mesorhabditis spiculigera]
MAIYRIALLAVAYLQYASATSCSLQTVFTGFCFTDGAFGGVCGTGTCVTATDGTLNCCPAAFLVTSTTTTTTVACVDKTNPLTGVSDCPARVAAGYCTRKYYKALMKSQCRLSCGYCTATSYTSYTVSGCYDRTNPYTGVSDCSRLSYLCTNSAYYAVMVAQCPLTCGFCSG